MDYSTIRDAIDLLDDCVNSLANYKLLQKHSNDPIGAKVTQELINQVKRQIKTMENQ